MPANAHVSNRKVGQNKPRKIIFHCRKNMDELQSGKNIVRHFENESEIELERGVVATQSRTSAIKHPPLHAQGDLAVIVLNA